MAKFSGQDSSVPINNPLSILFLGSQMETGGAQRNLLSQASWFKEQGHPVTAAFLYDKEGLQEEWQRHYNFPIVNLKARRWNAGKLTNLALFVAGFLRAARLVFTGKFKVIETFTHHANLIGIPLAWLAGIPIRIATHRGRFKDFSRTQEKLHACMVNSKMTTCLLTVSEPTRQAAIEEGIHAEKISIIPNGVEPVEIDPVTRQNIRSEAGVPENSFMVLSVGRLRYEKGHTFLLQAIPFILSEVPNVVFILAGDGSLRKNLEAEAEGLGVSAYVRFLGTRQDAPRLMAAADIFVLPSRTEGMPNALLEAMAAGTAVVAFAVGGVKDILTNQKNGMIAPPQDPSALSDALLYLLKNQPERLRIAQAGKELVLNIYGREQMCSQYLSLLNNLHDSL